MGEMGGALFKGPVLHHLSNSLGRFRFQVSAIALDLEELLIDFALKGLFQDFVIETIASENLGDRSDRVIERRRHAFLPKRWKHGCCKNHDVLQHSTA